MSSFYCQLMEILYDAEEVEGLPDKDLRLYNSNGDVVCVTLTKALYRRILRLQTLAFKSNEACTMSDDVDIRHIATITNQSFASTKINLKNHHVDVFDQINMINRLIIELVREYFPEERNRYTIGYHVDRKGILRCLPRSHVKLLGP